MNTNHRLSKSDFESKYSSKYLSDYYDMLSNEDNVILNKTKKESRTL